MQPAVPLFPEQASTVAARVDALYFFLLAVSGFFAGLIFFLIIYFAVKYRRRSESEPPPPRIAGDLRLEAFWTLVPLAITVVIFVWSAVLYVALARPPEDAMEIFVVARQWMWKFQHPDGQQEINELHVPAGRPIKLVMATQDVIHSFFVPAFRVKQDVVPGRYTTVWFEATKPGSYHLFCAEYCGTAHSAMIGRVVVLEPKQYEAWLGGALQTPEARLAGGARPAESLAAMGGKLFQRLGCATCHRLEGRGIGPVLAGLFDSEVRLQDGRTVKADESYLRESILNPQAKIVAGFQPLMPSFQGRVREDEIQQLIAYIKSLGPKVAGPEKR
ncbi:MAG TPA: cytochrome c oxidase subunit II [Candidatus Acidoferrales bacterium]|nr:cytochrome c oxidase subunit II [Candidatus Acidoferrales bacterium]